MTDRGAPGLVVNHRSAGTSPTVAFRAIEGDTRWSCSYDQPATLLRSGHVLAKNPAHGFTGTRPVVASPKLLARLQLFPVPRRGTTLNSPGSPPHRRCKEPGVPSCLPVRPRRGRTLSFALSARHFANCPTKCFAVNFSPVARSIMPFQWYRPAGAKTSSRK